MPTFETTLKHPQAKERLSKLQSMVANWDSYGAEAPSDTALRHAGRFLDALYNKGHGANRIAPSAIGGVGITIRNNDRRAYIEYANDGKGHMLLTGGTVGDGNISVHSISAPGYLIDEMAMYLAGAYRCVGSPDWTKTEDTFVSRDGSKWRYVKSYGDGTHVLECLETNYQGRFMANGKYHCDSEGVDRAGDIIAQLQSGSL